MINKIKKIVDYQCFRSFSWSSDLKDFNRYNLIWGWNGSGKTTLSKIFRYLERGSIPEKGKIIFEIDNQPYDLNKGNNAAKPAIKVFNKDFVNENISFDGTSNVNPIFYIGKRNIENQKEIESLNKIVEKNDAEYSNLKTEKENKEKEYDRLLTERAREIKDILRTNDKDKYSNYNKNCLKDSLDDIESNYKIYMLNQQDIDKKRKVINSERKEIIDTINVNFCNIDDRVKKTEEILKTSVITETLFSLQNDKKLSDWVLDGLEIHKGNFDICQFCGQPIPSDRIERIEKHFSSRLVEFKNKIEETITEIENDLESIEKYALPSKNDFYESHKDEFSMFEFQLTKQKERYIQFNNILLERLMTKNQNIFEIINIGSIIHIEIDYDLVNKINKLIDDTNKITENHAEEKRVSKKAIEKSMVANVVESVNTLLSSIQSLDTEIKAVASSNSEKKQKIDRLQREMIDHKLPADEINTHFKDIFGYEGIKLETLDRGYRLTRNNETAFDLSEGEKTAISLIYFIHTLNCKDFKLKEGVVVVDDPISSLDSNNIFHIAGLIRSKLEESYQLFILTHNYSFFREIKKWINNGKNKKCSSLYQINCIIDEDNKYSIIGNIDRIIEKYDSEYIYLFNILYDQINGRNKDNLFYLYPNIARKVLETFFHFKKPDQDDYKQCLRELTILADDKREKIIRFTDKYSHQDSFDRGEFENPHEPESLSTIKDVLDLIEAVDKEHYTSMKSLCDDN